jgi:hypothetical protein
VVLAATAVLPFENSSRSVADQIQTQEPTNQLRELAEHLLKAPFPTFLLLGQEPKVQLLPGQLPSVPPLNLPTPPKGHLLGSAVYRLDSEIALVDILLQVPGTAENVMDFYRSTLPDQGWQIRQSEPLSPGFHPDKIPAGIGQIFCLDKPTEPWFNLSVGIVSPSTDQPNNVRIYLLTQAFRKKLGTKSSSPCDNPPKQVQPEPVNAYKFLPSLKTPVGIELKTTSSCAGKQVSDASISTVAKTNKDAVELEASIARQLEEVGWTRVTGHAEKPLAWSMWQIPAPGKWQGVLLAIQSPQENYYLISVQITSQEKFSSL